MLKAEDQRDANAKANRNQRGRNFSYGALKSNHIGKGGREHNQMPWLRIEGDYLSPLA
ncbi:hypothetical protein KQ300_01900 [Synechococcus sp. CS-1331]|nr:hypothetical protein [Synechococcus sp. CS-1331]NQW38999.1 hypothetical protein [Cyanobacteria bacterium bin.275]